MRHIAKNIGKLVLIGIFMFLSGESAYALVVPNTPEEQDQFKQSIENKSKELEQVNSQIRETQSNLTKIDSQKRTLSSDLKKIDYTLNQVNLGIKASEINIQKLNLELESLNGKVYEIEKDVDSKKAAISDTIRKINESDKDGTLQILLKNESLVKGAFEVQALQDVQDVLSLNVNELKDLHEELTGTITEKEKKKNQVETENKNLRVRRNLAEDQKQERKTLLVETKNKEQVYQAQLSTLQKQQEAIAEEIQELEAALRGRIDATQIPAPRPGTLAYPVPHGTLTQGYGQTSFALRNYPGHWHNGIDIGKFLGAEIVSAEDGRVVAIGNTDRYCPRGAYGKFIVVKHYNGLTTLYAHLSAYGVNVGDEVERGQPIAYMGRTGWATGPHLHFVVYDSTTYTIKESRTCGPMPIGGDINPRNYLLIP